MSSDFILHLDLTDSQREDVMAQFRESEKTPLEAFLQDVYVPRAIEAYQGGNDD